MARLWTGKWVGGRTRQGKDGKTVWVIEVMRDKVPYSISLTGQGEPQGTAPDGLFTPPPNVLAEFALFERNPVAFKASMVTPKEHNGSGNGVPSLNSATLIEFLQFKAVGDEDHPPVSEDHVKDLTTYLKAWLKHFSGRDLRTISLTEYQAVLAKLKQRRKHIIALRSFTKWLRRQGRGLTSANDATRDLAVPQPKVNKDRASGKKLAYSMEEFEILYSHIRARPRGPSPAKIELMKEAVAATKRRRWEDVAKEFNISTKTLSRWKLEAEAGWPKGTEPHCADPVHCPPFEVKQKAVAAIQRNRWAEVAAQYGVSMSTLTTWNNWLKRQAVKPPFEEELKKAQAIRDVLALRALTGLHHSEIKRLAQGAFPVESLPMAFGEIKGATKVWHKNGSAHPQALCAKALAAGRRLQAAGKVPRIKIIHGAMDRAAKAAGLLNPDGSQKKFRPGKLRSSFITWSRSKGRLIQPDEAGVPLGTVAELVGHKDTRTTSVFYDETEVPPLIVLPLNLKNEEDPE